MTSDAFVSVFRYPTTMKNLFSGSKILRCLVPAVWLLLLSAGVRAAVPIAGWDPTGTTVAAVADGSWEGNNWATNTLATNAPLGFVDGSFTVFSVTNEAATSILC